MPEYKVISLLSQLHYTENILFCIRVMGIGKYDAKLILKYDAK